MAAPFTPPTPLPPGGGRRSLCTSPVEIFVVTLFPELFEPYLSTSIVGRAVESGAVRVALHQLRAFGLGKHQSVDDTPYGGGSGMVMRVEPIALCLESIDREQAERGAPRPHRILLTPQGRPFRQARAMELSELPSVALVCGRYEGFDERVRSLVDEEISLGDFVMTGGEVAAMAIIDACVRLLPGVLGNDQSAACESHDPRLGGLLEYPQYTRPVEFRGMEVPAVLREGNHAAIAAWRRARAIERTRQRRPDLRPGDEGEGDE